MPGIQGLARLVRAKVLVACYFGPSRYLAMQNPWFISMSSFIHVIHISWNHTHQCIEWLIDVAGC
jgi:hypothetical protein